MLSNIETATSATSVSASANVGLAGGSTWLAPYLRRGRKERFSFDALITPDIARAMLAHNAGNRPVSPGRVAEHIRRLKAGTFILTHQGIAFSRDGILNDGQHRLTAVSESDVPAKMNVTFGCERIEFSVVDQGKGRGVADLLAIRGHKNYATVAAIANALYSIEFGRKGNVQEIETFALQLGQAVLLVAANIGVSMKKISSPTSTGAAVYWIAKHSQQQGVIRRLEDFWHNMASGENLTGCRLRLREWLKTRETSTRDSQMTNIIRSAAIVSTWNSWLAGRKTASFEWGERNKLPRVS